MKIKMKIDHPNMSDIKKGDVGETDAEYQNSDLRSPSLNALAHFENGDCAFIFSDEVEIIE